MSGATRIALSGDGALVAQTGNGPVSFTAPRAWQDIMGRRTPVRVSYALAGDRYGFRLGDYDRAYPVIIDPLLQSTYLGGIGDDGSHAVATDANGNVFVVGYTRSPDFLVTPGGPLQTYGGGPADAFVAKLNNTLTAEQARV